VNQRVSLTWGDWIASGAWQADTAAAPLKPQLLGDVLDVALDGDVEARRLIRFVSREPVLTAAALRLANSAAYAALRPSTTVDQAVVRVGTRAVRSLVLSMCFATSSTPAGQRAPNSDYVDHGIGTACIASLVAARSGVNPDEAFVCGLLHDIGKLFLTNLRTRFIRRGGMAPGPSEEEAICRDYHAVVGGVALEHWRLPDTLREPVRWHHDPFAAPAHAKPAAVVYVANRISHRLGFGCSFETESSLETDPVFERLELREPWIADTADRARILFEGARQLTCVS
jgi:putative nucleotidyltransferase with HDIG domain